MKKPENKIRFHSFDSATFEELLEINTPPFDTEGEGLRQLRYLENYLNDHIQKCQAVAIEHHYIDRDYMEDHSVFYSRNLFQYANSCKRVHFFSIKPQTLHPKIKNIIEIGYSEGIDEYKKACKDFSDQYYLGFSVIKPLNGCPVGRTVLKQYESDAGDGHTRHFNCTRIYNLHFAGIELTIRGLAFQQQDVGVSACATTALWSALHKTREFEDLGQATPAQITRLASQYTLPFGRSMPSEGLSIDQMCQAVQALGISPNLLRITDYETARGYLYSACKSEFAQVLIIEDPEDQDIAHAVTVVGMKLGAINEPLIAGLLTDRSAELNALYVHDDRFGPYLRANLINPSCNELHLDIGYGRGDNRESEEWNLTHILIPMHGKIRLSFDELRLIAMEHFAEIIETIRKYKNIKQNRMMTFETLILRSHSYIENLFSGELQLSPEKFHRLRERLTLSRYVGLVRISAEYFGCLDFLIDTTSTPRNVNCLHIIALKKVGEYTEFLVETLADLYDCSYTI